MILTKKPEAVKTTNDYEDMPSNDENEDKVPKPTDGRGILFGLTNSMVVIEFLIQLKTYPELWRPQMLKDSINQDLSIRNLCAHLNNRFDLNIQDSEMRVSIKRVKDWYFRMLKNMHEHNNNLNNTEPYKHPFPLYFRILNQFLISDDHCNNNLLVNTPLKSDTITNKQTKYVESKNANTSTSKPQISLLKQNVGKGGDESKLKTTTLPNPPPAAETTKPSDINMDNLIEFDADTLYDHESSDEEVLKEFDETKMSNDEIVKTIMSKKRRTKVYTGHFQCDLCSRSYKRKYDVKRHRVHHFPPEFECAVCSQKFYFKHWAEKCNHIRKKQIGQLSFGGIKRTYNKSNRDNTITQNTKRVWPKKIHRFKLICEICGASYRQIGSLNCHKRDKHLNQRLKCIVCHFTALTNYRIVQHQKKRHIVEPGTVEEVAKRSRARTETKTRFSTEARQEFDWRREQRKKLAPGEKFFACCKCRIIFNSRKEKVLHNKMEHPITETTVVCLLCLPNQFLLSNSNSARRHYTDIHKVPWDEIDALVKRTKPVFNVLSKEEIELLNASENYKELLEEFLKDRQLEPIKKAEEIQKDETSEAVQNLPNISEIDVDVSKVNAECMKEENVCIDGIIDHDYNNDYSEERYNEQEECSNNNEHNYSEEQTIDGNYNSYIADNNQLYVHHNDAGGDGHLAYNIEHDDGDMNHKVQDDQEYLQSIVDDIGDGEFVDGEFVEECIVVEECVDEVSGEEEEYF